MRQRESYSGQNVLSFPRDDPGIATLDDSGHRTAGWEKINTDHGRHNESWIETQPIFPTGPMTGGRKELIYVREQRKAIANRQTLLKWVEANHQEEVNFRRDLERIHPSWAIEDLLTSGGTMKIGRRQTLQEGQTNSSFPTSNNILQGSSQLRLISLTLFSLLYFFQ